MVPEIAFPQFPLLNDRLGVSPTGAPTPTADRAEIVVERFPFVLGRHTECDATLLSRRVSRRHCQFFQRGPEVWVEDLNSHNGTHLNERPIRQAEALHDGDLLIVYPYYYRCHLETAASGQPRLRLKLLTCDNHGG